MKNGCAWDLHPLGIVVGGHSQVHLKTEKDKVVLVGAPGSPILKGIPTY